MFVLSNVANQILLEIMSEFEKNLYNDIHLLYSDIFDAMFSVEAKAGEAIIQQGEYPGRPPVYKWCGLACA